MVLINLKSGVLAVDQSIRLLFAINSLTYKRDFPFDCAFLDFFRLEQNGTGKLEFI